MELRHIRYFLAVAEEGNFTRAAQRLGIGQPPLSMQIKDLEAELGVQLFYRLPYGAELTEAGKAFFEAVKTLPQHAIDAVRVAQRAARGETGQLSLGFTGTAALHPAVPASIRAFKQAYPDAELTVQETNSAALVASLLEGRLDVAILRPADSNPEELKIQHLVNEPLVAALPVAHSAAGAREGVDLAAFTGDPLIVTPRAVGTSLHDAALKACRDAGFEPLLGPTAPQIGSLLSLVAAELGFALVPSSMRQLNIKGVVYRPILGPVPHVGLAVAYRGSRPSPLAVNFGNLARIAARQAARSPSAVLQSPVPRDPRPRVQPSDDDRRKE